MAETTNSTTEPPAGPTAAPRWAVTPWLGVPRWMWAAATTAAVLLIGPGFAPGAWLNLDLVVVAKPPLPTGTWGLGPELPRRVPLWIPITWLSSIINGEVVARFLIVAAIATACCGAYRMVGRGALTGVTAAVLYGLGPFFTTRIAVGHWMVVWAMALLPWAVGPLLRPLQFPRRILWWSAALGVAGVYGGILAGAFVIAGLVVDRESPDGRPMRRRAVALLAFVVGQLPWLVPLVVVGADGSHRHLADSSVFAPPLAGVGDLARLTAGLGFWDPPFQIGKGAPFLTGAIGLILLGLAVIGTSSLPRAWGRPVTVIGVLALVLSASSAAPGLEHVTSWFTATTLGAPLRETQRYLAPFLLWTAPAAALGASARGRARMGEGKGQRGARRPGRGGQCRPARGRAGPGQRRGVGVLRAAVPATFPDEWAQAKATVEADPGTVVAFPWFQYFTLDVADNRLVLNVVPYYFGGDVIASTDPGLSADRVQEGADPREQSIADLADRARAGEPVADRLAAMGVRWLVLQHEINWEAYTGVLSDPGLEPTVVGDSLTLYRVVPWKGNVVTESGTEVASDPLISPWLRLDPSAAATWAAPYQDGSRHGTETAGETADGLVLLPAGSGPVWFWPALLVLLADAITIGAIVVSVVDTSTTDGPAPVTARAHRPDVGRVDPAGARRAIATSTVVLVMAAALVVGGCGVGRAQDSRPSRRGDRRRPADH